jgi:REP element-mobilizing transposase RayT
VDASNDGLMKPKRGSAYDPVKHHRRSIRLKGYDYAQAGVYFVTICTQDRACLFGDVVDGEMRLGDAGRMIRSVWDEMPTFYPGVDTDEFVVMPNHVHGGP